MALTFDDGPDPVSTPAILDGLEALGWRATFFCLGSQVRRAQDWPGSWSTAATRSPSTATPT